MATPSVPTEEVVDLSPFKRMVMTIGTLPTAFTESMTYYEALAYFVKYLEETVIPAINQNAKATEELQTLFTQLEDYVNNYFDNLDVQEEINNKLDAMAESGQLEEIIAAYLQLNSVIAFTNVESMIASDNMIEGSTCKTYGYYSVGDGGGCEYTVSSTQGDFGLLLSNGLYANPVLIDNEVVANKLGVKCDKTFDNKTTLQAAITYCKDNNKILVINGYAYTSETINTKGVKIKGLGINPDVPVEYNSTIGFDYIRNQGDGANITFAQYCEDMLVSGSGIISDTANPILECKHSDGKFKLENITICGWLRNSSQEGLLSTYESNVSYINGRHYFNNVYVINCGNNGIHLQSLEETNVYNLRCRLNGGNGLYIECPDGKDAPTEYCKITDSHFDANFKNGIHIKNGYRKNLFIENSNFSRAGLYSQLQITPDSNPQNNYGGILIEGKQSYSLNVNQQILVVSRCYAEECCILCNFNFINTSGNDSKYITNNITIKDNSIYAISGNNTTICYLHSYYSNYFTFLHNYLNGSGDMLIVNNSISDRLFPLNCDNSFYSNYNFNKTFSAHENATYHKKNIFVRDDVVYLDASIDITSNIAAYQSLITSIIKPIDETIIPIMIIRSGESILVRAIVYANGTVGVPVQLNASDRVILNSNYRLAK